MTIFKLHSMRLQKKWNLIQNSVAIKKGVAPKRPLWKKMWNLRWQPRNGCDDRLMAKLLITAIQVNLVLNPSETWRRQHKFTWIVVIKNFAISLPSQSFLGRHLVFHIFFHNGLFGAALFLQLDCFGLDNIISWEN